LRNEIVAELDWLVGVIGNVGLRFRGAFAGPNAPPRGQKPSECNPDDQANNPSDCAGDQRFGLYRLVGHCGLVL
jgi:hypothetical protein